MTRLTEYGQIKRDQAGAWHYEARGGVVVGVAAADALARLPPSRPGWFWFNGTPTPVIRGGDPGQAAKALVRRWEYWRVAADAESGALLLKLCALKEGSAT